MSTISATAVKTLRDRTNAPMMECKTALTEANGDMEKAVEILRKKSKDIQDKKGAREATEGRIAVHLDPKKKVGAIIEVRCESAPVAKSDQFIALANDLARQVVATNPKSVEELLTQPLVDNPKQTVNDRIGEVVGLIRENMKPARFLRLEGILASYVHHDSTVGVLLQVEGKDPTPDVEQTLRDVCMHIAAKAPVSALREDVPKELVEKELAIAKEQAAATGKPANIVEKIAEGKMKTWYAENVLVEQPFVKDDSKTVGDLLKSVGLKMVRFARYRVGEVV